MKTFLGCTLNILVRIFPLPLKRNMTGLTAQDHGPSFPYLCTVPNMTNVDPLSIIKLAAQPPFLYSRALFQIVAFVFIL